MQFSPLVRCCWARGDARGTDREGLAELLRGRQEDAGGKGNNPYFSLTPGYRLSYKHGSETDVVMVLNETRMIDGVECRVAEDREEKNGQLVELTHDYYAIRSSDQ